MDWYPWFPSAFRRKTFTLSLAEDGAYRRLIDEYMIERTPLWDDDRALARILGVGLDEWLILAPKVRKYFTVKAGKLHNQKCDEELRAQDFRFDRYSVRGKKAAFAKYNKINEIVPRRMLVPTTLKKEIKTSSEYVAAREESGQPRQIATPELQANMQRKLSAR